MATGKLIGSSTNGTSATAGNYVIYAKFIAEATGKITEIKVYSLAAGNAKIAIYVDNNGEPGNKLTGSDYSQAVTLNQWNTLTINETNIIKDTVYWIGICTDTTGASSYNGLTGIARYKAATFSSWSWPASAGSGFTESPAYMSLAGWGILILNPSSISQPVGYGSPRLNLSIKPSSIVQQIVCGSPKVDIAGIVIIPQGISVVISYGTPTLKYPQTLSPSSIVSLVSYGIPSVGIFGFIKPQSTVQPVAIGTPTILKYVWHVILDGRYATETPGVNRAYIIGRDRYGNPVYGTAVNTEEVDLVGERLDFQPEPAIPTTAQTADVASAILAKMRLMGKSGIILIPPNCGQELFDVVQISDAGANQIAIKFRVVGIRFEYNTEKALYQHRLILGAP
jgi:hypothetical protein